MKPSEIISLARRQTWCTEDIVTEDEAYKFLNFVIEDFGAEIRLSDAWYGLQHISMDIVAWQNRYDRQIEEMWTATQSPVFAIDKILKVWILNNAWEYDEIPVRFVDKIKINDILATGKPKQCFISNNSLILVPTPKENWQMIIAWYDKNFEITWRSLSVWATLFQRYSLNDDMSWDYPYAWRNVNWNSYRYTGSKTPSVWSQVYRHPDGSGYMNTITAINGWDIDWNIWIPERWHYVLVEWMKYRLYGNMGVDFEWARINARNFFDSEKMKAIQQLTDRWQMAETWEEPYLDYLWM